MKMLLVDWDKENADGDNGEVITAMNLLAQEQGYYRGHPAICKPIFEQFLDADSLLKCRQTNLSTEEHAPLATIMAKCTRIGPEMNEQHNNGRSKTSWCGH